MLNNKIKGNLMIRHAVQSGIKNSQVMGMFLYLLIVIHDCKLIKIAIMVVSTKELKMI
jgi:hypothetical protein